MEEMKVLRKWLEDNKGRWTKIASETGLSTKTLSRIANGEVESVHLSTYAKIREAMQPIAMDQPQIAA
ncbi:Helix-turn-helix transcriptional regulator [Cupriavidus sp. H19C3]|uniref:helix-turn-helix domain-containing protein n=1 Tax=Cupriavidus sp. H19C3 TaxID=3241603 RepID=UPI003BF872D1